MGKGSGVACYVDWHTDVRRGVHGWCRPVPSTCHWSGNRRSHDENCPCAVQSVNGLILVMRGLLAWPMLCGLRMPPAFNVGAHCLSLVRTDTHPITFNARGPHARGLCQATPLAFVMHHRPCGSTISLPEQRAVIGSIADVVAPDVH